MTTIRHFVPAALLTLTLAGCALPGKASPASNTPMAPTVTAPAGPSAIPTGRQGTPRGAIPKPGTVQAGNASAVAHAYAVTSWTYDTRLDTSPNDAGRRGLRWLGPELRAALSSPLPGDGGTTWAALKTADGYSTVTAVEMPSEEPQTPTRVQRYEYLDVQNRTNAGKPIGTPERLTLTLTLTRDSATAPWLVTAITTE